MVEKPPCRGHLFKRLDSHCLWFCHFHLVWCVILDVPGWARTGSIPCDILPFKDGLFRLYNFPLLPTMSRGGVQQSPRMWGPSPVVPTHVGTVCLTPSLPLPWGAFNGTNTKFLSTPLLSFFFSAAVYSDLPIPSPVSVNGS